MGKEPADNSKRIERVLVLFLFVLIAIILRLFWLQVISYPFFKKKAEGMHLSTVQRQLGRGVIYDRNGRELAVSTQTDTICATPKNVVDKAGTAGYLAAKLGISRAVVLSKLRGSGSFEYIKRKVPDALADEILEKKLPGIYAQTEEKRFYPFGPITAHIVGCSDIDNKGLEGLELHYEKYLKGKLGSDLIRVDARRRQILGGFSVKKAEEGANLHLTIDENIQYLASKEIKETCERSRAKGGSIIVMNPNTGEIYAAANYPVYDPNEPNLASSDARRNRMITDVYEPGSTFKIFTMSAYLKKFPNVDDEKTFCGNGKQVFQFGKYTRTVHDHEKHGWLTHTEIIKVSSNIGIVDLAQKLQPDDLYQEYIKYGFGTKTGVDMPGEVAGMLRPVKDWDQVTMTTIPYGQEISVTALQLIRAYAAVANGGCMVEPYVVEKIEKNGRNLYSHSGQKNCGIVDNIRRLKLVSMLESVVQKGGSGTKAFIPGYNIAGKTGTAQVHNPNGKGYLADKYVASFIGFMPADKPEAVTLVIVNQPAGGLYFGGDVAAPIFKRLNTMMASYFKVSQPEVQNEFVPGATLVAVKDSKMPELKGKKLNDVRALLAAAGIKYKGCGAGNMIIGQDPEAGKKVKQGDSVVLYLAASGAGGAVKYYMPDVRGLTVRRTVEVLAIFGLKANCSGNGFAVSQDPKPGTAVEKGRECAVNFVMKEN